MTEATVKGIAGLVKAAESGAEVVVARHRQPVAAVIGMDRLAELEQREEDLRDAALVLARAAMDDGRRYSFDEVLTEFGLTEGDLGEA